MVGVEAQHDLLVAQGIFLNARAFCQRASLGGVEDALNFGAVDQTAQVGLGNEVGRQQEVLLELGWCGGGAVYAVKGLESSRSPDDESAEMTTRGQLEKVESVDRASLDTWQVAGALNEIGTINLRVVDDKGSTSLAVTAASQLALSSSQLLGLLRLDDIGRGADSGQDGESVGGLGSSTSLEDGGVDNQGNLRDARNLVAAGEEKRGNSGGSKSRGSSESPSHC